MSKLKPLIRLHRWRVDEERRKLAAIIAEVEKLDRRDQQLAQSLAHETKEMRDHPEGWQGIGEYVQRVTEERRKIAIGKAALEEKIAEAQEEVRQALGEAKKYEIVDTKRALKEAAEEKAKESDLLDEVALTGFRRKTKSDL